MPTYEYACAECGHGWEEVQKISEPALEVCPACHKHTAKRQISGGNFILKGGGWYSDLYSSSSNKPKSNSDGEKGSSPGSSESKSGSSESKPAETKTDTPKTDAPKTDSKASTAAA